VIYNGVPEALRLVGYEGQLPPSFPGAAQRGNGLYVPAELARRWGAAAGDVVDVVSPQPTLSPLGPQPRLRRLPLAGTFESSVVETRQRAALPLTVAEGLLGRRGRILELTVRDLDEATRLAPLLRQVLPAGSEVRTWRQLNRSLYFVLRLEKTLLLVAVGLIVLVASLALVVDLALVIASKRSEIGILGAMGASPSDLRRTFLALGGLLASLGLVTGTALGVGLAWAFDRYHLLSLPGGVLFVDYIPFRLEAADLLLVLALTVVLVTLASGYAAHRAAQLRPVEALQR
jgi:lipoprotein-releasing system permease protein